MGALDIDLFEDIGAPGGGRLDCHFFRVNDLASTRVWFEAAPDGYLSVRAELYDSHNGCRFRRLRRVGADAEAVRALIEAILVELGARSAAP